MAAAIIADSSTNVLGDFIDAAYHIINREGCELVAAKCIVQITHIRDMMLVVMDLHRLRIDVRLKRVVVVRQWWKFECHKTSLLIVSKNTRCVPTVRRQFLPLHAPHPWWCAT